MNKSKFIENNDDLNFGATASFITLLGLVVIFASLLLMLGFSIYDSFFSSAPSDAASFLAFITPTWRGGMLMVGMTIFTLGVILGAARKFYTESRNKYYLLAAFYRAITVANIILIVMLCFGLFGFVLSFSELITMRVEGLRVNAVGTLINSGSALIVFFALQMAILWMLQRIPHVAGSNVEEKKVGIDE